MRLKKRKFFLYADILDGEVFEKEVSRNGLSLLYSATCLLLEIQKILFQLFFFLLLCSMKKKAEKLNSLVNGMSEIVLHYVNVRPSMHCFHFISL